MPASIVRSSPLLTKYKNESQRMYLEEEVDYMCIAILGMIAGVTVLLLVVVTVCFRSLPFHISLLSSCSESPMFPLLGHFLGGFFFFILCHYNSFSGAVSRPHLVSPSALTGFVLLSLPFSFTPLRTLPSSLPPPPWCWRLNTRSHTRRTSALPRSYHHSLLFLYSRQGLTRVPKLVSNSS